MRQIWRGREAPVLTLTHPSRDDTKNAVPAYAAAALSFSVETDAIVFNICEAIW